jgi:xanthine/uracil/vitamin C permease (AzgA family)
MDNKYYFEGTVKNIGDIENITDKFSKRSLTCEYTETWEKNGQTFSKDKIVDFNAIGTAIKALDKINIGDTVKITGTPESREWKGKYFTSINITYAGAVVASSSNTKLIDAGAAVVNGNPGEYDLPF